MCLKWRMQDESTKEGYRFLSLALLHTTNCLKESKRNTERLWAGGREEADSKTAREKEKEDRETEGEGGSEID